MRKTGPAYSKALDIACKWLEEAGACKHFSGFLCDKDFTKPGVCAKCLRTFLLRKAKEEGT